MMISVSIPEAYRPAFGMILELPESDFGALVDILSTVEGGSTVKGIAEKISTRIEMLDQGDAELLVPAIEYLYRMMSYQELDADDLSFTLALSLIDDDGDGDDDVDTGNVVESSFSSSRTRLQSLLKIPAVSKRSKRSELIRENERKFCSIRIITDIRPIFGEDASLDPDDLAVVHTAHVRYHVGTRLEDLFLSLNRSDMRDLEDAIARARQKEETLRNLLQKIGARASTTLVEEE